MARMPEVRRGIAMPLGHGEFGLRKRWQLGRSLAGSAMTRPSCYWFAVGAGAAVRPFRAASGFRGEMRYGLLNDIRPLDKQLLPMTVQRFVALACRPIRAAATHAPAAPAGRSGQSPGACASSSVWRPTGQRWPSCAGR